MSDLEKLRDREGVVASPRQNWEFKLTDAKGRTTTYQVLEDEILELYPQCIIKNSCFVCIYLPTKINFFDGSAAWENRAYFLINGQFDKKLMPADDPYLTRSYKIVVNPTGYPRWDYHSIEKYMSRPKLSKMNPFEVFHSLKELVKSYIDFDEESTYDVFCIWIIGTYLYRIFEAYPYLDFTGTKRAGKTKALEIIRHTAFNSIMSPDFTGSTIFRLIEGTCGTLCIDEAEAFQRQNSETAQHVRTLIMQGFLRNQFAYRTNSDRAFQVEGFNLYSPKALAHISTFDDVLGDRCIQIVMKRSTDKTKLDRYPTQDDERFARIRGLCYEFFLDHGREIEAIRQKAMEQSPVHGREGLLWQPLLVLAFYLEPYMPGIYRNIYMYAQRSKEERQATDEEDNLDYRIANFIISQIFETEWVTTEEIYRILRLEENVTRYSIPGYFNARHLGHVLKRLGFKKSHTKSKNIWQISKEAKQLLERRLNMIEETGTVQTTLSPLSPLSPDDDLGTKNAQIQCDIVGDNVGDNVGMGDIVARSTISPRISPQNHARNDNDDNDDILSKGLDDVHKDAKALSSPGSSPIVTSSPDTLKVGCTKCANLTMTLKKKAAFEAEREHKARHGQDHEFFEILEGNNAL